MDVYYCVMRLERTYLLLCLASQTPQASHTRRTAAFGKPKRNSQHGSCLEESCIKLRKEYGTEYTRGMSSFAGFQRLTTRIVGTLDSVQVCLWLAGSPRSCFAV